MIWDFLAWVVEFFTQRHREYVHPLDREPIPTQERLWD